MVNFKITNKETFENAVADVQFDNISCSFDRVGALCSVSGTVTIEKPNGTKSIFSGEHGLKDYMRDYGFIIEEVPTFDVEFNSDNDSDSKGFEMTLEEAQDYIETWNGSGRSYFGDYKGGTVSIINNLTGESVEDFEIKSKQDMKISKGKWAISREVDVPPLAIKSNGETNVCDVWNFVSTKETEANAALIVDAGNTANECGLMPSELLSENITLTKSLRDCLDAMDQLSGRMQGYGEVMDLAQSLLKND